MDNAKQVHLPDKIKEKISLYTRKTQIKSLEILSKNFKKWFLDESPLNIIPEESENNLI